MSKEQTPMNSDRIREIQEETAYPNSVSVQQALLKVWNECEQYHSQQINAKVLEALERDLKDLSDCYKAHAEDNPRKEVCQVLHTLIMEKHEQIAQTKQK